VADCRDGLNQRYPDIVNSYSLTARRVGGGLFWGMKTNTLLLSIVAIAVSLAGCETNRPQEVPDVVEISAAEVGQNGGTIDAWWVIVCPHKTDAPWFRISIGPDDHNITQKIVWRQGDPLQFQLLHGHDFTQIYVAGYSGQDGKTAYFGICHDSQICARHFQPNQTETSGGEGHLVRSGDTEAWDCQ
jgi:hypothetical protein